MTQTSKSINAKNEIFYYNLTLKYPKIINKMNLNEIMIDTREKTSTFLYPGHMDSRINTLEEDWSRSRFKILG